VIRVAVDPEPAIVTGDGKRLRQVATILLDNAIRHSPRGGTVTATVRATGSTATLVVDDQGSGIREEDLPHIFDRFWRAPGAPSGGTGLGLAIAGWIVTRHGGRIGAANRPEGGARFTVELPIAAGAGTGSSAGRPAVPAPRRAE
jgi:signal transduction histidine kinase